MISSTGLLFAFLTAILFTSYGLLARVLSAKSESPLAFSVLFNVWATVLAAGILLIEPWKFGDLSPLVLFITFLATLFFGLYAGCEYFMRKHLEASRSTIFFQLTPVITFIGSVALLAETVSYEKVIALALIIGGNIVAIYKHGGAITRLGVIFALGTIAGLGFAYIADKAVFAEYPLGLYVMITYFFPGLYVFFVLLLRKEPLRYFKIEWQRMSWRLPVLAVVGVAGYYFMLKTFSLMEVSVAVPITYSSTVLTALGGIVILRERGSVIQKLLGASLVFTGVVLLA